MKYDYSVIYNGVFYRAGEEVPVKEDKKTAGNTEAKTPENSECENIEAEPKKPVKRRTKA